LRGVALIGIAASSTELLTVVVASVQMTTDGGATWSLWPVPHL
jgi:hypothetical protein